ncbi:MAG: transcription antitermination factor NusB [Actinomycetota bacterium]|nr:transcription antitermination factor NusB [Actinomycetota bacterium]
MRRTQQRRAAVVALYQQEVTGRPLDELLGPRASEFTRDLVDGVEREREALDERIERHSVDWALERIAPLERSILRVALFEIVHRSDVPAEVAIDEAVEAAKELCGAGAPGFVNGVLAAAHRDEAAAR